MSAHAIDSCTIALQTEGDPQKGSTWVHLLPAGTFSGRDGRGPYIADDPEAIIEVSRQVSGRREIPIDYEHQIDHSKQNGQPAPAAGWIKGMQARKNGIWGLVDWTPRAAAHIAAREYRYLSPVIRHLPNGQIMAVTHAALVSKPNLDQLTALASMEERMDGPTPAELAELRQLLGLKPEDGMSAILDAIRAMQTQTMSFGDAPDPSKFVPIGDFIRVTAELNRVHQGIEAQSAKMYVEDQIRSGKLFPFIKDWAIDLCTKNKPAFDDYLKKTGGNLQRMLGPSPATAAPPPDRYGRGSDLSDTDAHVASVLGHTSDHMKAGGK